MTTPDSIQIFVPLTIRKRSGRPRIVPPGNITQEPAESGECCNLLRAIGLAWSWRRRLGSGEFETAKDLAAAIGNHERYVSRHLRLTYLAPSVLRRLVYGREVPSITIREMTDLVTASWEKQEEVVFFGG